MTINVPTCNNSIELDMWEQLGMSQNIARNNQVVQNRQTTCYASHDQFQKADKIQSLVTGV